MSLLEPYASFQVELSAGHWDPELLGTYFGRSVKEDGVQQCSLLFRYETDAPRPVKPRPRKGLRARLTRANQKALAAWEEDVRRWEASDRKMLVSYHFPNVTIREKV